MTRSRTQELSRRGLLGACLALAAAPALAARPPRVVILGDSIAAGYGLPHAQALPSRLQRELARIGRPAQVLSASVVGDTTAGGARRVDRALSLAPDVCVVALGGNDLLQGLDPAATRANLERIVGRLRARGVTVVLAGVQAPSILAGAYASAFGASFASVARSQGVIFLPDLLAGVALRPELNQRDGIHPNAAGVAIIARRLAPLVAKGLAAR